MTDLDDNLGPLPEPATPASLPPTPAPAPAPVRAFAPAPAPAKPAAAFPSFYKKASFGFLALGVVGLGLVIYAVMSSAKVIVMAKPESLNKEFAVDLAPKPGPDEVLGVAIEAADTIERSFPVTADASVKTLGRAVAKVKIESALAASQTLITKTRLVTPTGVQFRLTKDVTVPAHGSVEVEAVADEAGAKGQVGLATFTIPGLRAETRKLFTVTATAEPIAAEETASVGDTGIPDSDLAAATAVLKDELQKRLTDAMRESAKAAGVLGGTEIIAFPEAKPTATRQAGSTDFTVAISLKGSGVYYDRKAFLTAVTAHLKRELPAEREVRSLDEKTMTVTVEKTDKAGTATVRVRVTAEAALTANSPALSRQKLVGIKRDAAIQYLQALDGVNSADIIIQPLWASRMPSVPGRILLEVR